MTDDRRPIRTRSQAWVPRLNQCLLKANVKPDDVSAAGIVFAIFAGGCFMLSGYSRWWYLGAAVFIQLRLLCNMMDGMLAIEGKLQSKLGEVYNELPDRYEDTIIIVCAGYAAGEPAAGWAAALFALMTAYLRRFGASLGTQQYFSGPLAKPQRMFVLTVAAVAELIFNRHGQILTVAVYIVLFGSLITCLRRRRLIVTELLAK